ncbi:hypothetical protein B0T26DRAFT_728165 [Lasiosphaeria miniovina]|uniref:Uncharacterized protein n=1 Tax=Lasiosphaeria miniovina TaxID=1954250 RepID=A0AA40DKB3_9PEZI|nr:uncharacterized protein B0T26DRAFT_728165 [Lasiosphaeria miniovina]KAK0706819.1 hypothetical protein B0T26DRAFT_728165 [Lasiosphaeria miniovina]
MELGGGTARWVFYQAEAGAEVERSRPAGVDIGGVLLVLYTQVYICLAYTCMYILHVHQAGDVWICVYVWDAREQPDNGLVRAKKRKRLNMAYRRMRALHACMYFFSAALPPRVLAGKSVCLTSGGPRPAAGGKDEDDEGRDDDRGFGLPPKKNKKRKETNDKMVLLQLPRSGIREWIDRWIGRAPRRGANSSTVSTRCVHDVTQASQVLRGKGGQTGCPTTFDGLG